MQTVVDELMLMQSFVVSGVATAEVLHAARRMAHDRGVSFAWVVSQLDGVDDEMLANVMARVTRQLRLPVSAVSLDPGAVLQVVPLSLMERTGVVPLAVGADGCLLVGAVDPSWGAALDEVALHAGRQLDVRVVSWSDYVDLLSELRRLSDEEALLEGSDTGPLPVLHETGDYESAAGARLRASGGDAGDGSGDDGDQDEQTQEVAAVSGGEPAEPVQAEQLGVDVFGMYGAPSRMVERVGDADPSVMAAFSVAESGLRGAGDREVAMREVMDSLSLVYPAVMLFCVRTPVLHLRMWRSHGRDLPPAMRRDVPLERLPFWRPVVDRGLVYVGECPCDDEVLMRAGGMLGSQVALMPIALRGRTIQVLLLSGAVDVPLPPPGHGLLTLPRRLSEAYGRFVEPPPVAGADAASAGVTALLASRLAPRSKVTGAGGGHDGD